MLEPMLVAMKEDGVGIHKHHHRRKKSGSRSRSRSSSSSSSSCSTPTTSTITSPTATTEAPTTTTTITSTSNTTTTTTTTMLVGVKDKELMGEVHLQSCECGQHAFVTGPLPKTVMSVSGSGNSLDDCEGEGPLSSIARSQSEPRHRRAWSEGTEPANQRRAPPRHRHYKKAQSLPPEGFPVREVVVEDIENLAKDIMPVLPSVSEQRPNSMSSSCDQPHHPGDDMGSKGESGGVACTPLDRIIVDAQGNLLVLEPAVICDACPFCEDTCEVVSCTSCREKRHSLAARPSKRTSFTLCEVRRHRTLASCWLVAKGQVYDVTRYLSRHPAGAIAIARKAGGKDCTDDLAFHSCRAQQIWKGMVIGTVKPCNKGTGTSSRCSSPLQRTLSGEGVCSIM